MTLRFLVAEGITSVRRVAAASTVSAFVIGVVLSVVGGLMIVALAYRSELSAARASAGVEVFLEDDVTPARAETIAAEITSFPSVLSARVRSREEAARLFDLRSDGDSSSLGDILPLPLTIELTLEEESRGIAGMAGVRRAVEGIPGVEDVAFPGELAAIVDERSETFFRIASAIGIAMALGVIGIMATTAQLAVVARRSVIRTMWLLGAERRWVVAPFAIQGVIIGLTGGLFASTILYASWVLFPGLEGFLEASGMLLFPLLFPLVGGLLGGIGAWGASRYYTREVGVA